MCFRNGCPVSWSNYGSSLGRETASGLGTRMIPSLLRLAAIHHWCLTRNMRVIAFLILWLTLAAIHHWFLTRGSSNLQKERTTLEYNRAAGFDKYCILVMRWYKLDPNVSCLYTVIITDRVYIGQSVAGDEV